MESISTAAWAGPYELQLVKNWTTEVAPADGAQVWAPAVGQPLQYGSIAGDMFGSSCNLQPYVVPASSYSSGGQQQMVEYNYYNYYPAAAQHHDPDPVEICIDPDPVETYIDPELMADYINSPEKLFQEKEDEFKNDAKLVKTKMHRYPPIIQALGDWCTVPKVLAIGPYYHRRHHLQKAEKMKHVAAQYCIKEYKMVNNNSGLPVLDLYGAVASVASEIYGGGLYDKDVVAGIGYVDIFLPMMFYDACFLVMYILRKSGVPLDRDLYDFFEANDNDIALDIMLVENQIPLQLVEAVMNMCTAEPLEVMKNFVAMWLDDGFLQGQVVLPGSTRVDWDQDYYNKAPHLLGLLRFYAVKKKTRSTSKAKVSPLDLMKMESIPISAGAIELAEMFISLTANKTTELPNIGLAKKWIIFEELSMPPLSLNDARARWLANMAAHELCTTPDFFDDEAEFEDSAVCSYLLLLSMLMHQEEDVHELRTKGILQGEGLNNNKTLDFFSSLHSLRKGRCYALVVVQIQNYKNKRPWIMVYSFVYNNWKYIVAFVAAITGLIGIISTLKSLMGAH